MPKRGVIHVKSEPENSASERLPEPGLTTGQVTVSDGDLTVTYDQHAQHLYSLARQFCEPAVAETITANTLAASVLSGAARASVQETLADQLLAGVHRRGVDLLRADKNRLAQEAAMTPLELEHTLSVRAGAAVDDALSDLTRVQRTALILAYYGGYSSSDIAAMLHRSRRTVNNQLSAALRGLSASIARRNIHCPAS